jgi:uncharacterized protein
MPIELDERGRALENEYFRRKEQELIEKMKEKIASDDSQSLGLKCPKCDGTLHASNFENIVIDVCDSCHGVWLDAGELAQITHRDEEKSGLFGKIFG